jgi:hypothetical protein
MVFDVNASFHLSVSAIGSNRLQRPAWIWSHSVQTLSVSAIGSNRLQRSQSRAKPWRNECFQYPQSDRIVCNRQLTPPLRKPMDFQYPQSDRIVCNSKFWVRRKSRRWPFSIRNRIESSATMLEIARLGQTVPFSIRNRIESSATPAARLSGSDDPAFQYPQSDRIVCNYKVYSNSSPSLTAFSIRNRIESSATGRTAVL